MTVNSACLVMGFSEAASLEVVRGGSELCAAECWRDAASVWADCGICGERSACCDGHGLGIDLGALPLSLERRL